MCDCRRERVLAAGGALILACLALRARVFIAGADGDGVLGGRAGARRFLQCGRARLDWYVMASGVGTPKLGVGTANCCVMVRVMC